MITDSSIRVIVGLGNPGSEFNNTRHNLGFLVIEELINKYSLSLTNKFNSLVTKHSNFIVCKPLTYMNNSGKALFSIREFYRLNTRNILVIYDDMNIPLGSFKYSLNISHGGHNGIKSIHEELKSNEFIKLRVGIGLRPKGILLKDYVLMKFTEEELEIIKEKIPRIIDSLEDYINGASVEALQTKYN